MKSEMFEVRFGSEKWVPCTASNSTFVMVNLATGEAMATLLDAGREEMRAATDAAASVQKQWAARTAAYHSAIL